MSKSLKITIWCAATAVLLMFNGASVAYAQGTWTSLAPVPDTTGPAPTEGMAVGTVGQVVVAAYGLDDFIGDTNLTRRFNISTNSWSFGATAPGSPSSEQTYGELTQDGFVYVIGGRNNGPGSLPLPDNRRYDVAADTWTTLAPMPTARAGAAGAVVDAAIFVIGGRTGTSGPCSGGELSVVERYDIATNTWSTVAPLPSARTDLNAVSHGGKIFVFGGCTSVSVTGEVDKYDPETNTWTVLPTTMPNPRASMAVGTVGDTVFTIDGTPDGTTQVSTNDAYKISTNTWTAGFFLLDPTARAEVGVASHGGRIYVVGGGNRGVSTAANEVFKPF